MVVSSLRNAFSPHRNSKCPDIAISQSGSDSLFLSFSFVRAWRCKLDHTDTIEVTGDAIVCKRYAPIIHLMDVYVLSCSNIFTYM